MDLGGRSILVTREEEKAWETAREVERAGGIPIVFPTIATQPMEDPGPLKEAIGRVGEFDWVAVTSRTGARVLVELARDLGVFPGGVRLAAVGGGTADELRKAGLDVAVVPKRQDGEGLAMAMASTAPLGRVLVLKAMEGRDTLATMLVAAGFNVQTVAAYRTVVASHTDDEVRSLLSGPRPDAALFMSPSAFHGLLAILGTGVALHWLADVFLVAIGPVTADAMARSGATVGLVASEPRVASVLDELARRFARR